MTAAANSFGGDTLNITPAACASQRVQRKERRGVVAEESLSSAVAEGSVPVNA